MIGPVKAGGALELDPAPPDDHGVECAVGFEDPADGPDNEGKAEDAATPPAPGTYRPLAPAVRRAGRLAL